MSAVACGFTSPVVPPHVLVLTEYGTCATCKASRADRLRSRRAAFDANASAMEWPGRDTEWRGAREWHGVLGTGHTRYTGPPAPTAEMALELLFEILEREGGDQ